MFRGLDGLVVPRLDSAARSKFPLHEHEGLTMPKEMLRYEPTKPGVVGLRPVRIKVQAVTTNLPSVVFNRRDKFAAYRLFAELRCHEETGKPRC